MIQIYMRRYDDNDPSRRHITEHELGLSLLSYGLLELFGLTISASELPDHLLVGTHKKPYLKDYPQIHFNISHCRGLVVCAISDEPVGIDTENIRPFKENLLRKVLTPDEQVFLDKKTADGASREEWFFRFWTLKESRIKQSGTGMSVPLNGFSFQFHDNGQPTSSLPGLIFYQEILDGRFVLSVCSLTAPQSDTFSWL